MDFGEMFRAIRQQWIVAAVAVLLTLVVTVGAYLAWPNKYQSVAQITLVGSTSLATQTGNGNNAYLTVGNLTPMAGILETNLSSDQAVKQLKALGVTEPYTVQVPPFATGPFLAITVTGTNKAEITRSVWTIINFSARRLIQLQTNTSIPIPKKSLIQAQVIAQPTAPARVLKTKIEVVAGVAVVGIVLSFLLIFGLENARMRRTAKPIRRRPVRTAEEPAKPITIEQYTGKKAAPADGQPTGTEPEPMISRAVPGPFPAPEPEIISPGASPAGGAPDGRDRAGTSLVEDPGSSWGTSFWDSGASADRGVIPVGDPGASAADGGDSAADGGDSRGISFWDSDADAAYGVSRASDQADDRGAGAPDGGDSRSPSPAGDPGGSSMGTSIWDRPPTREASPAGDPGSGQGTSIWDSGPARGLSASPADDPAGDPGASAPDGGDSSSASPAKEAPDDDWREKTVPSIPVIR